MASVDDTTSIIVMTIGTKKQNYPVFIELRVIVATSFLVLIPTDPSIYTVSDTVQK
jgi:hypothetical protein